MAIPVKEIEQRILTTYPTFHQHCNTNIAGLSAFLQDPTFSLILETRLSNDSTKVRFYYRGGIIYANCQSGQISKIQSSATSFEPWTVIPGIPSHVYTIADHQRLVLRLKASCRMFLSSLRTALWTPLQTTPSETSSQSRELQQLSKLTTEVNDSSATSSCSTTDSCWD